MSADDGIRFARCLNCNSSGWVADGMGDWIRCHECNRPPPPKASATVLTFARGALVRRPAVDSRETPDGE
jgi:hypothetical protein